MCCVCVQRYLGTTGVVEQVDMASVRLRHEDGQNIWWAYGAVELVREPPRNDKLDRLKHAQKVVLLCQRRMPIVGHQVNVGYCKLEIVLPL